MVDYGQDKLKNFQPKHTFFVGIDSDGCVFDSMEIKHKECFCPAYVNNFNLQAVAKYAREVWDFVNLYSITRGYNRFKAVTRALDLLAEREEVKTRNVDIPKLQELRNWVSRETRLGNPVLEVEIKQNPHKDLEMALAWSLDVNAAVKKIVRNVPPFPKVREALEKLKIQADIIVVSQTPTEALNREWEEHDIAKFAEIIAGQELGTKAEHIQFAANGKYEPNHILMVGDAPGDLKAARANNALFYPVNPGKEEKSWKRFYEEATDRFFEGTYKGEYEQKLIEEFEKMLPERPPWT